MLMAIGAAQTSNDPSSNKKVGSIIVKNGEVVGSGNRQVYIFKVSPYKDICIHAEHIALMEAGIMAKRSTVYCTMEPCTNRHIGDENGILPPKSCCDLLIDAGVDRVCYLSSDNYIGGGGEKKLLDAGIKVEKFII